MGLTARRVLPLQPGQNIPPPVAMKRNPETGELEEFHSHKLQDDLPEEEVRKSNLHNPLLTLGIFVRSSLRIPTRGERGVVLAGGDG